VIIILKRNLAGSKDNWHAYASHDYINLPPPTVSKVGSQGINLVKSGSKVERQ